jgi:hypothetical protein
MVNSRFVNTGFFFMTQKSDLLIAGNSEIQECVALNQAILYAVNKSSVTIDGNVKIHRNKSLSALGTTFDLNNCSFIKINGAIFTQNDQTNVFLRGTPATVTNTTFS